MASRVSVIICTRNRSRQLVQTLAALQHVRVPNGMSTQLIVVDNGSIDDTAQAIQSIKLPAFPILYLSQPAPGISRARNTALRVAEGEILLFIDDDIRPQPDWLLSLVTPLARGGCDAVVGRIDLAPELWRPWMKPRHKRRIAVPDLAVDQMTELIGGNMGFHRRVLAQVPTFDTELGAGGLGSGEDTLFSFQLHQAGYRLRFVPDARVTHHPDPSRLLRAQWLGAEQGQGRASAYILYHWEHTELRWPAIRIAFLATRLRLRRLLQPPPPIHSEGIPEWEMSYALHLAKYRHFLRERVRPRNYVRHGLVKLDNTPDRAPPVPVGRGNARASA